MTFSDKENQSSDEEKDILDKKRRLSDKEKDIPGKRGNGLMKKKIFLEKEAVV